MTTNIASRHAMMRPLRSTSLYRSFATQSPLNADTLKSSATRSLMSSIGADMDNATTKNSRRSQTDESLFRMASVIGRANTRYRSQSDIARANEARQRSEGMERLQTRSWTVGDIYAPHDLSPAEMKKWRVKRRPDRDVFDQLSIDPLNEWKNFPMLSEFMTSMGRIKHSRETGLRPVNQRKVAKAIRRAVGMGFHPSVHYHPEMLRRKGPWQFR